MLCMSTVTDIKELYDVQKRGSEAPIYTVAENSYRSKVLSRLQQCFVVREGQHMELNNMTYSEYYLINRQQDMAYNPPKRNLADSRIVSGVTHEKDSTILSILTSLNLQPKVRVFDSNDHELVDASTVLTARLKKALIKDNFKEKEQRLLRVNISQGNVFSQVRRDIRWTAKKIQINKTEDPAKKKFRTVLEKTDFGTTTDLIPNTGIFFPNIIEPDMTKQPYLFAVMHLSTEEMAQIYKDFPRWKNVPKYPSQTVPVNVNGIWGDYFLQIPTQNFTEVIIYQNQMENECNVYLNGVQMFPVDEQDGMVLGYPLTEFSASGKYNIVKGDNELIPFFAYGKSTPAKTQVKEETINELMRLMVYKMRQSAKPPVGNNSDKILQSNVWDPGVITPDIRKEDLSILTPNAGITSADFQFYNLVQQSISDSSVSASVEGTNTEKGLTATQYLDQKRENLKKLGLSIDNTIQFYQKLFWLILYEEIDCLDQKESQYDLEDQQFKEAYSSFSIDHPIDGSKGRLDVKFVDDNAERYAQGNTLLKDMTTQEDKSKVPTRTMYVRPDYIQGIVKNLSNKIYIDVVAEPEGQGQQLLGALFNLLTEYANLRGGDTKNINFDYIEKIIGENSGFDSEKIFTKAPPVDINQQAGDPSLTPDGQPIPGVPSAPKPSFIPVNKTKKAPNTILAK